MNLVDQVTGSDPEMRVAGLGGRSYAFLVDWHIRVFAGLAWYAAGAWVLYEDFTVSEADSTFWLVVAAPAAAVYLLYHPVFEVITGSTPGKRIAGVRIVDLDGRKPSVGALAIRNALRPVDSLVLYAVGVICVLITRQEVRLGDMAAGTVLIYMESSKEQ